MNQLAHVDVEQRGAVCVVRLSGEVDMSNAPELFAEMERAVPNGAAGVVVDLSNTRYVDSAGVRLLFLLASRLRFRRQELRVVAPEDGPVRTVLELAGLGRVVPIEGRLDPDAG